MNPDDIIRGLVKLLSGYPEITKVILFGSRADHTAKERSDIDLAVEVAEKCSSNIWNEIYFAVEEYPTLLKIDLVRLDQLSEPFLAQIEAKGKTIYERS